MIKHNITLTRQKGVPAEREITNTLKAAVTTVLRQQKIGFPCEVSLYLCREDEIQRLNQTYRNIGTPTDVLSFPAYNDASEFPAELPEGESFFLGDIAICAETADRQAEEFGHERKREYAFLAAHAALHLLGFDHEKGSPEEQRHFAAQEQALAAMGLPRPEKTGRCGTVSIIGRPNAGKSTLMNRLVGEKIAIVSPKPQTTRNRITGILTQDSVQYIFMDTPGLHKPKNRLDDSLNRTVYETAAAVDAAVLVVEAIPGAGKPERLLLDALRHRGIRYIIAINKIDKLPKAELLSVIASYAEEGAAAIIPISAKTGDGLGDLLAETAELLPQGRFLFPEDELTDQPERVLASEFVREKLLGLLGDEIPHGIATETERYEQRPDGVTEIDVIITCERTSHKKIVIGKKGGLLKSVGEQARKDIEALLGVRVFLSLWVRVREHWRDDESFIRSVTM